MVGQSFWSKFELNLNKQKIQGGGGDVEDVFQRGTFTYTASGMAVRLTVAPHGQVWRERGKQGGGGASPEITSARRGPWLILEGWKERGGRDALACTRGSMRDSRSSSESSSQAAAAVGSRRS